MAKVIISVKDLGKRYGDFTAVKGISFDVMEGEIFGLLGPNGAGKSTTLEIIETLREKTSGEVIVDGLNLDRQPNEIKKNYRCAVANVRVLSRVKTYRAHQFIFRFIQ